MLVFLPLAIVAIAYVLHKAQYMFPIIGGRKVEHLMANVEALSISLTPEQIKYLDELKQFKLGFPHDIVVSTVSDILPH